MKRINLLPRQNPIHQRWWIIGSVSFSVLVALGGYFFLTGRQWAAHSNSPLIKSNSLLKGLLINYPISKLRSVGFLKRMDDKGKEVCWGLISVPDAQIMSVKVGDRIGREQAQIIKIESSCITLQSPEGTTQPLFIRSSQHKS